MKIAVVGNQNNFGFSVMSWLRDYGYDAELFYYPFLPHFTPFAETFELDILKYCHKVEWPWIGFPPSQQQIKEITGNLSKFEFFIGCGKEVAWLTFIGIELDIYIPYGGDIAHSVKANPEYPLLRRFINFILPNRSYYAVKHGTLSKYLHKAIVNSKNIMMELTSEKFHNDLIELNFNGKLIECTPPILYHKKISSFLSINEYPPVHWMDIIKKNRSENEFILLYHGRQVWEDVKDDEIMPGDDMSKNVHYLIKGFADFLKRKNNSISCKLILIEYGPNILKSKELINQLEITESVFWFPIMQRKDILYLISQSDLCSGEFGMSFLSFGTILEAMLMGKPIIHHRDDKLYIDNYDNLYPMLNAKQPNEISKLLLQFYNKPKELEKMGQEAKKWAEEHFIKKGLEEIIKLITVKQNENLEII